MYTGMYPLLWTSQVVLVINSPPASAGDMRDMGSISELGRSPEGGHGNPLQYSCLENPLDRGAWQVIIHTVAQSCSTEATSECTHPLPESSYKTFNDFFQNISSFCLLYFIQI